MNHIRRMIAAPSRCVMDRRLGFGRSSASSRSYGNSSIAGVIIGAPNIIDNASIISRQQQYDGQLGRAPSPSRHCVYSTFGYDGHMRRHFFGSHATQQQHQDESDDDELASKESVDEQLILAEVEESNKRTMGHIQVKRVNEHQWGVFTSRPYTKGSTVISSSLLQPPTKDSDTINNPSSKSCSHSIQIDWDKHILMELPARFLNHCCDPNIGVDAKRGLNASGSYDFVALRDIEAGEQVRFDYETTEYEVGAFETCHCGATNCRGTIAGYRYNSDIIRAKYGEGKNVAGYLLRDQIE